MRRRPILAAALATAVAFGPWAHAADPQVTDPAGDANGINSQLVNHPDAPHSTPTPAGSQDYADVTSILWENATVKGQPGFKVTVTLVAPPTPPVGTVVYRILGKPSCEGSNPFFGVVYYTTKGSDEEQPQSAIRDNCIDATTRLTEIDPPVIKDNVLTWSAPLSAIPKDTGIKAGSVLTDLYFETVEIEDFGGTCLPDDLPAYAGACGLGVGRLDLGESTSTFKL